MREIKFRAWIKSAQIMVDVESIDFIERTIFHRNLRQNSSHNLEPVAEIDPWVVSSFDDIELMQFTGLFDKNGVEIYEGDIVLVLDRDWPSGDYSNQTPQEYMRSIASTCEVVFEEGEFLLKQHKGKGYFNDKVGRYDYHRGIYEVIGNLHEHPELLK